MKLRNKIMDYLYPISCFIMLFHVLFLLTKACVELQWNYQETLIELNMLHPGWLPNKSCKNFTKLFAVFGSLTKVESQSS